MLKNTLAEYGSVSKFLHWVVAVLVLVMLMGGFFLDDIPDSYKGTVYNIHKLTGLTILLLMVIRSVWNTFNVKPELAFDIPAWQKLLAKITHLALYVFVIAMTMVGWIGASAAGRPPQIAGVEFLYPIEHNKGLAKFMLNWHGSIALVLIGLISLHILAALYHHFVRRDNTLMRMLPKK